MQIRLMNQDQRKELLLVNQDCHVLKTNTKEETLRDTEDKANTGKYCYENSRYN